MQITTNSRRKVFPEMAKVEQVSKATTPSLSSTSSSTTPLLSSPINSSLHHSCFLITNIPTLSNHKFCTPMDSKKSTGETAIRIDESNSAKHKKTAAIPHPQQGWKRGVSIFDFILRICALAAALAAAAAMGTTDQKLPFFTQFFQFQASYDDLPTFTFFVVANAIASGYLVLSLPFSIVAIVRPHLAGVKLLLVIFDTVVMALTTAAAAAAAAIVYLAHNGNSNTNWFAICQQFNDFCQRVSGAVVASFIAAVLLVFLVVLSAVALRRH